MEDQLENKGMKKAVIFDLDGTLVNSIEDIADSMNCVLEKYSYETHDYESYQTFVGYGLRKMCELAMPESARNDKQIEECFGELMQVYSKNCVNKTRPYKGIKELLRELKNKGIRVAVFSNKVNHLAKKVVDSVFADFNFDIVIGSGGAIPRKPDITGIDYICKQMNLQPDDYLYVGDSGVDMQTATGSGIYAVGVLWGFRDMEELLENNADVVIEQPLDLLDAL